MITLGIDLSSQPPDTAACLVTWGKERVLTRALRVGCTDADLDELIEGADVIGIDAPFGWPVAFRAAVGGWAEKTWQNEFRDRLRYRSTDLFVHEKTGLWPLSVSTDRIALPAMRAMALLCRHNVCDRSGDGRFFEVYPAASLRSWRLEHKGYKQSGDAGRMVRHRILAELCKGIPNLDAANELVNSDHGFDAFLAALTVRVAASGRSILPEESGLRDVARTEGWIHLPSEFPKTIVPPVA
jgi:predicted nuclease with RNAse H fold